MSDEVSREVRLAGGDMMPVVGLGTWTLKGDACSEAVREALTAGYRHIDTAEMYANEEDVRRGIEASGVARGDLFITSKAWRDHLHRDDVVAACEGSLKRLGTDYLDLYLIHWPNKDVPLEETFEGFKELLERGLVRAVGVSNFSMKLLDEALLVADRLGVPLSVNQVEFHPFLYQQSLLEHCKERGVQVVGYSPLARGGVVDDDTLVRIAGERKVSPAQVALRWALQRGLVVIPKGSSSNHILTNLDVFGFSLGEEEMKVIDGLDEGRRQVNPSFAEF